MNSRVLRVFVASPGDVNAERETMAKLVAEINQTVAAVAPEKGISLEVVRWETHAHPAGGRPQAVINQQLRDYDIFVGIMWKRFGTPSVVADSGTEEEFELAYAHWQQHGRPEVMFYFCQQSPGMPDLDELAQLSKVLAFRQRMAGRALSWEYASHADFADTVRPHLLRVLAKAIATDAGPARQAQAVPPGDAAFALEQLQRLAVDYAQARSGMRPGDARTRQMEVIVTRMRSFALAAVPALDALCRASEAGERLAAIAVLQVAPQPERIAWLAEQCRDEQPFVGYHAAMALLTATRGLGATQRPVLEAAIQTALAHLQARPDGDRYRTLKGAMDELRRGAPV